VSASIECGPHSLEYGAVSKRITIKPYRIFHRVGGGIFTAHNFIVLAEFMSSEITKDVWLSIII